MVLSCLHNLITGLVLVPRPSLGRVGQKTNPHVRWLWLCVSPLFPRCGLSRVAKFRGGVGSRLTISCVIRH